MRAINPAIGVMLATTLLICACLLKAEEAKPLTTADVASMVKAGLPESTVILAIQMAGQRASVNFNTSPAALTELRKASASEKILNAVLWAQTFAPKRAGKSPEISAAPGLPIQPGVYYRSASGWIAVHSFLLWPPWKAPWNVAVGFRRKEYGIALSGLHARAQIAEPQPTFYVREPPSLSGWQLLRLGTRKDHRELRIVSDDSFFSEIAFQSSAFRQIELKALAANVFTVRPRVGLDPGEYLLCATVPGGHRLLQCYEFGITVEKPQVPRSTLQLQPALVLFEERAQVASRVQQPHPKPRRLIDVLQMDIRRGGFLANRDVAGMGEPAVTGLHRLGLAGRRAHGPARIQGPQGRAAEDDRSTCM